MVASIVDNGGRSCVNASGVWVDRRTRDEIAEALAERLAAVVPRAADDRGRAARAVRRSGGGRAHLGDDRRDLARSRARAT